MDRRRTVAVAVLGLALVVAAGALASVGLRLQTSPGRNPPAASSAVPRLGAAALEVFDQPQTSGERTDAAALRGLGVTELGSLRELGRIEGLQVLAWRTAAGEVCLGLHRPGDALPITQCARAADFADGGLSVHWPDSPDIGPFDVAWRPDGRITVASTLDGVTPSARG